MFIVEGRTLGVIAALGAVLSMVLVFDRLSDVADPAEPHSPAAITTPSAIRWPIAATTGSSLVFQVALVESHAPARTTQPAEPVLAPHR